MAHPLCVRFRFELAVGDREVEQLGHALRAEVGDDGRWVVRDPEGTYPGIGRHEYFDLAVLDYIRQILAGEAS